MPEKTIPEAVAQRRALMSQAELETLNLELHARIIALEVKAGIQPVEAPKPAPETPPAK